MELELEFGHALCYCSVFRINGIKANYDDFGEKYDNAPDDAEEYGCGDMRFFPQDAREEILSKYSISKEDYDIICLKLEEGLSFGGCGWCI